MEKVSVKNAIIRMLYMMFAMTLFSFGMILFLAGNLGSTSVATLQQAMYNNYNVSFGVSNFIINGSVLLIFLIIDRKYFHVGTLLVLVWPGVAMDFARYLLNPLFTLQMTLPLALVLSVAGAVLCATGLSIFLPTGVGLGPMDMLVFKIQEKLKISFKIAYYMVNGVFLVAGILLGGS